MPAPSSTAAVCPKCGGSLHIPSRPGFVRNCDCVLKQKALDYLTAIYTEANLAAADLKLSIAPFKNRNVVIQKSIEENSKEFWQRSLWIVKSYLLLEGVQTDFKYRHRTLTPYEYLRFAWNDLEECKLKELLELDLLVLTFRCDPARKYGDTLPWFLSERTATYHKPTWILTERAFSEPAFRDRYSRSLADYLLTRFDHYLIEAALAPPT